MVVQHNLQAMNANRMLGINTNRQASSTEKLTSGYKINRAADNAAGLAISEKMRKQIRGLSQASVNAEDGISCVQTADGALAEVHDMLQRMNELVVQSANGTNSESDRQYIQDEIDQLVTEIDRVSETTKFNEIYLLNGDAKNEGTHRSWITDYKMTDTPNLNAIQKGEPDTKKDYIGHDTIYFVDAAIGGADPDSPSKAWKIQNGDDITPYLDRNANGVNNAYKGFMAIQINRTIAPANATVDYRTDLIKDAKDPNRINAARDLYLFNVETETVTRVARGESMLPFMGTNDWLGDEYRLVDDLFSNRVRDGLNKDFDGDGRAPDTFRFNSMTIEQNRSYAKLYDADGKEVSAIALGKYFDEEGLYQGGLFDNENAHVSSGVENDRIEGYVNIQNGADVANDLLFDLHVGSDSDRANKITAQIVSLSAAGLGVEKLHSKWIGTVDDTGMKATDAIDVIAEAIRRVSTQRSLLGAVQNRLEHTVKNLDNIVENTQDAESTIRDTDMATEMVQYSNNNVLMQAGQSMLAQANQANQGILSMLS